MIVRKAIVTSFDFDSNLETLALVANLLELKGSGIDEVIVLTNNELLKDAYYESEFKLNGVTLHFENKSLHEIKSRLNNAPFTYLDNKEVIFKKGLFATRQLLNAYIVTKSTVIGLTSKGVFPVNCLLSDGKLSLLSDFDETGESNLYLTSRCLFMPEIFEGLNEDLIEAIQSHMQKCIVYGYEFEGIRKCFNSKDATNHYLEENELLAYIKKLLKEETI